MEDSESILVPILDSGITGGSGAGYIDFVDSLEALGAATSMKRG